MTIIETAKLDHCPTGDLQGKSAERGLDPQAYLADILNRTYDHKINRLYEVSPWQLGTLGRYPPRGRLMAAITHVRAIDYVAKMLGEDFERLKAIVSNNHNLRPKAPRSQHLL